MSHKRTINFRASIHVDAQLRTIRMYAKEHSLYPRLSTSDVIRLALACLLEHPEMAQSDPADLGPLGVHVAIRAHPSDHQLLERVKAAIIHQGTQDLCSQSAIIRMSIRMLSIHPEMMHATPLHRPSRRYQMPENARLLRFHAHSSFMDTLAGLCGPELPNKTAVIRHAVQDLNAWPESRLEAAHRDGLGRMPNLTVAEAYLDEEAVSTLDERIERINRRGQRPLMTRSSAVRMAIASVIADGWHAPPGGDDS